MKSFLFALLLAVLSFPVYSAELCQPQIIAVANVISTAETPAEVMTTVAESNWQPVALPHSWLAQWPDYNGVVWYRIQWQRSGCSEYSKPEPVAMSIDSIVMAGQIFLNNDLLWRDRHLTEPLSRSWNSPRYLLFPESIIQPGVNTLWFRVSGNAKDFGGIGLLELGKPEHMLALHAKRTLIQRSMFSLNMVISAVLGILALFVWLQKRSQHLFGWYALFAFCWLISGSHVLINESWFFSSTDQLRIAYDISMMLLITSFCMFLWSLIQLAVPAVLKKGLWWLLLVLCLCAVWLPEGEVSRWGTVLFGLIFLAASLHIIVYALFSRKTRHLIVAACMLMILLVIMRDTLVLLGVIASRVHYTPYFCFVALLIIAIMLGRQIAANSTRIEQFNLELQAAVVRACDELSETLEQQYSLHITNTRLQERLQLAHDLHDGLGGQISRSIAMVEHNAQAMDNQRVLSMLKMLRNDLRQVIDNDAGVLIKNCETPHAWVAAMRHRFVTLFDELDIVSEWHIPDAWQQQPSAAQCLALTRVLEEALTNVIKHSQASRVKISLSFLTMSQLQLSIEDNGKGFDVAFALSSGLGIGMQSMQQRMQRQHGKLHITSVPGSTVLQASISILPQNT